MSVIRWVSLPLSILKFNCDGAFYNNSLASCGNVLRDSNRTFILAFSGMTGNCCVVQAELWTIFHGLQIIKDEYLHYHIIIESDSYIAIQFLNDGCPLIHPCYSLLNQIVKMSGDFFELDCVYVF
uniref:Ribonuclease H protein At1g65750 family n=1 Tax=Cajanus cajan TaxID=3821 RepID=A0A151S5D8_CAJCA|nr:Putative ribonuclease H protein At1g65750 family [Cajanus cajan]